MGIARTAATDETGLVGHIAQVLFVSDAPWGADREGWLCPALFGYFEAAPSKIYAHLKARGE